MPDTTRTLASDDQRQILTILRALAVTIEDLRDEVRDAVARERRDDRNVQEQLRTVIAALRQDPSGMEAQLAKLEALIPTFDQVATRPTPEPAA